MKIFNLPFSSSFEKKVKYPGWAIYLVLSTFIIAFFYLFIQYDFHFITTLVLIGSLYLLYHYLFELDCYFIFGDSGLLVKERTGYFLIEWNNIRQIEINTNYGAISVYMDFVSVSKLLSTAKGSPGYFDRIKRRIARFNCHSEWDYAINANLTSVNSKHFTEMLMNGWKRQSHLQA